MADGTCCQLADIHGIPVHLAQCDRGPDIYQREQEAAVCPSPAPKTTTVGGGDNLSRRE